MVEPPLAGSVQVTEAWGLDPLAMPVTAEAVPMVGALGTVAGVRALEAAELALLPAALVAVAVNVYDVPAVRPEVIVHEVAVAPLAVQVPPAGLEVTV
jgi:hypothetical protein